MKKSFKGAYRLRNKYMTFFFLFLMCVYVLYFSNSLSSVQVTENLFHFSSFLASRRRFASNKPFFLRRITKSPKHFFLLFSLPRLFFSVAKLFFFWKGKKLREYSSSKPVRRKVCCFAMEDFFHFKKLFYIDFLNV